MKIKGCQNLIFCGLLIIGFFGFARVTNADINQEILDLRAQVDALTKQAEQYKKNITQKQNEADTLSRQISILNNQIAQLETQIAITEGEIGVVKLEIEDLEMKIFDSQEKINKEKGAIGKLITQINERDRLSLTAILIKNPTLAAFSDVIEQDQAINGKLNSALTLVKEEKEKLQTDKTALEEKRRELESLNAQQENQKINAEGNKEDKSSLLTATKGKEAEYQKMLAQIEQKQKQFFDELSRLEAEAVKSGAYIVHITAKSVPPKGTWNIRWPEDTFRFTQGYGMTAYAKSGAYNGAPHNGVDIAHGTGTAIHPIDVGAILASGYSDGWGNWVAVLHDNQLVSIYGHMKSPSGLANGTRVDKNSVIGYEGATGNATGSHLHLSIYQDFFTYISPVSGQLYFNYFAGTLNPLNYLP